MSERGYAVATIDELEALPVDDEGLTWRPVRRRFDIRGFGVNAYTAEHAGQRVVEEHREGSGHEELYVVVSGRAAFTLDGEEHDAPVGTLVFVKPDTLRSAFAVEDGTTVLGVGGKPGEAFERSRWEWLFAGFTYLKQGEAERGRAELEEVARIYPDAWQVHYNFACFEARAGDKEAALGHLERAAKLEPDEVARGAAKDEDLASLRKEPRFGAIVSTWS